MTATPRATSTPVRPRVARPSVSGGRSAIMGPSGRGTAASGLAPASILRGLGRLSRPANRPGRRAHAVAQPEQISDAQALLLAQVSGVHALGRRIVLRQQSTLAFSLRPVPHVRHATPHSISRCYNHP
jgi:hypothetical protein